MKPPRVRGEAQKQIVKTFDGLCGRHGSWEVWADWITLSACSISNAVGLGAQGGAGKTYRTIQEKYTPAEIDAMGQMLGMVTAALEENPDQDLLGDLFMQLELGNDHNGQFFHPLQHLQGHGGPELPQPGRQIQEKGWISVNDPACGAGALLVALANECTRQDINYQQTVLFTAQDIDYAVGMMCYIQLSLLGCPGYVAIGDTIAHPATALDRRGLLPKDAENIWYTPLYFHNTWHWRKVFASPRSWGAFRCPLRTGCPALRPGRPAPGGATPPASVPSSCWTERRTRDGKS